MQLEAEKIINQVDLGLGWLQTPKIFLDPGKLFEALGAHRTVKEVAANQAPFFGGELLVKIGREQTLDTMAIHCFFPLSPLRYGCKYSRSCRRPRWIRERTVPSEHWRILLISS